MNSLDPNSIKRFAINNLKVFVTFMIVYIFIIVAPLLFILNGLILKIEYTAPIYIFVHHLLIIISLFFGWIGGIKFERKLNVWGLSGDGPIFNSLFVCCLSTYLFLISASTFYMFSGIEKMLLYNTFVFMLTISGVWVIIALTDDT